eukprot:CAMPEP_0118905408 /NCGR_PEP_ID=MMETSP1166-20130328/9433_1 /TAXON_ID=1104430 /ORGANISM="Chrysoreinhardia sp, Strain CCMP3193" /LENGTH=701 /DNA_ID=CAMNT_0006844679 /DNA_START=29 /DNA_END=2134 /DNA_ORIENTATION=+
MEAVQVCGGCGAGGATKFCGNCKVQHYCSVGCQRSDWPRHKAQCPSLHAEFLRRQQQLAQGPQSSDDDDDEDLEEDNYKPGVALYGSAYRPYLDFEDLKGGSSLDDGGETGETGGETGGFDSPGRHGARVGLRNEGNTCYLSCVVQALTYSPLGRALMRCPVTDAPTKSGYNMMYEFAAHARRVARMNEGLAAKEAARKAIATELLLKERRRGGAAVSKRLLAARTKVATAETSVASSLLRCAGHAGRMEDAHECLTTLQAKLLEACAVGYDGKQDATWEKSTIVYDVFGVDLAQVVKCADCGNESKAEFSEYALRLNATLGLGEAQLARATSARASAAVKARRRTFLKRAAGGRGVATTSRRDLVRDDDPDDDDDPEDDDDANDPEDSGASRRHKKRDQAEDDDDDDDDERGGAPDTTVEKLLGLFFEKEALDDYACEKCKAKGKCGKGVALGKLPSTATLYVDRIPAFGALFGKLNRVVAFDQVLDLTPFLQLDNDDRGGDDDDDENFLYELYAVVCHLDFSGSTFFGHYVTYVCDENRRWWLLDDERVKRLQWDDVKLVNPDILFYAKVRRDAVTPPASGGGGGDDATRHKKNLLQRDFDDEDFLDEEYLDDDENDDDDESRGGVKTAPAPVEDTDASTSHAGANDGGKKPVVASSSSPPDSDDEIEESATVVAPFHPPRSDVVIDPEDIGPSTTRAV